MSKSLAERARRRLRRRVLEPLDARLLGPLRRRRNAHREFRPVFVTGAMGSGTTLLALSLGQRYEFGCVIAESAHQVARDSFLFHPGVDAFGSVRAYAESIRPREEWSVERGRADLLRMYRSHASGTSPFAVDKGPNTNLVRAGFLARCFPDGRFVVVFRDPAANVEGFRRKWATFAHDSLDEGVRFYAEIHERFLEESAAFPERTLWVEYEQLVSDYDVLLEALARRLGLRSAARARRLPRRANVPGQGIRNVLRGRIGVVPDANARARDRLGADELSRIRDALGSLHARMRERAMRA